VSLQLHYRYFCTVAALVLFGCTEPQPAAAGAAGTPPADTATAAAGFGTVLTVSAGETSAVEGAGTMEVEVRLNPRTESLVTVDYMTVGASARTDEDFKLAKGRLQFAPGQTSRTISVVLIDDDLAEDAETFILRLHASDNAVVSTPNVELTIIDDDGR